MAKPTKQDPSFDDLSIRDLGYNQAKLQDATRKLTLAVMHKVPSFPEAIPDETKEELISGYQLRFNEANPAIAYARVGDLYVPMEQVHDGADVKERVSIGVEFAMSFSQQAFGALRNEKSATCNPALHGILKALRDKVNKYCSNRYAELVKMAKKIQNEGVERTRTQADDFNEVLHKGLNDLQDRCKTAHVRRNDVTADQERFKRAKIAFLAVWDHQA